MYNEAQKKEFINYYVESGSKNWATNRLRILFEKTMPFEENIVTDLSNMPRDRLIEVACKSISAIDSAYAQTQKMFLREYIQWCINNKKTKETINYLVKDDALIVSSDTYLKCMLKDEIDLASVLNLALRGESLDTVDNMYNCYCHLLFAGLTEDEVLSLKKSQINFDSRLINLERRKIQISSNLYAVLKYYIQMDSYSMSYKSLIKKVMITKTDYLLENSVPLEQKNSFEYRKRMQTQFRTALTKAVNDVRKISARTILLSGIFSRMYSVERYSLDTSEYLSIYLKNSSKNSVIEKKCLIEYKTWKSAFYTE